MSVKHRCCDISIIFFDNFNPTTLKLIAIIITADIKVFSLFIVYAISIVEITLTLNCNLSGVNIEKKIDIGSADGAQII